MYGETSQFSWDWEIGVKRKAKTALRNIYDQIQRLTPAGKQMLICLLNNFNASDGQPLNRRQVAALLGRPSSNLTPHDRSLLDRLCKAGLLNCKRYTLWTGDNMACGAEFRYAMNDDTAWLLNTLRDMGRKRNKPIQKSDFQE